MQYMDEIADLSSAKDGSKGESKDDFKEDSKEDFKDDEEEELDDCWLLAEPLVQVVLVLVLAAVRLFFVFFLV